MRRRRRIHVIRGTDEAAKTFSWKEFLQCSGGGTTANHKWLWGQRGLALCPQKTVLALTGRGVRAAELPPLQGTMF